MWALGEGYADFRTSDPAFAAFLRQRLDLAIAALDRQVLASGTAVVIERADHDLAPLGAYAGVPVSSEDQVVSVLRVCDELGPTISRRDVAVLLELAELWSIELCRTSDVATVVDPVAIDLARGLDAYRRARA